MRITFVLPLANLSGGTKVLAIYAQELTSRGHTVTVVSTPPESPPLLRKAKDFIRGRGWPPSLGPQPSHLDGRDLDHHLLNRHRPVTDKDLPDADCVIATWWQTAEWVSKLSPAKGRKFYFVQHHEVFPYLPVERCRASYRLPLHKIVVSKWLQDTLQSEYGQSSTLVSNAVDKTHFYAPRRSKQTVPTIGFLYSRASFKGCSVAIDVINKLRRQIPDLRVVSFGSTPPKNDLPSDTVFSYRPAQADIPGIYASCDVWLSTSISEGFNLPAMEAMACRTPVVSTRTGWPEEAINGKNGLLADVNDSDALADAAQTILLSDNWSSYSEAAIETVAPYSWKDSAALLEETIEQVTRSRPTASRYSRVA